MILFESTQVRSSSTHVVIVLMWRRFVYKELFFERLSVDRETGGQASNWTWILIDLLINLVYRKKTLITSASSCRSTFFFLFLFFFDAGNASIQKLPTKHHLPWFIQPSMRSNQTTIERCPRLLIYLNAKTPRTTTISNPAASVHLLQMVQAPAREPKTPHRAVPLLTRSLPLIFICVRI